MPDFRRKRWKMLPKVLVIDYRPAAVPAEWNKTDDLVAQYIQTMGEASRQNLVYQIAGRVTVPDYPVLMDGRRYNDETWRGAMQDDHSAMRDSHGGYMMADYMSIIQEHALLQQVRDRQIDEVWMFGGPYFGFYESRMVGRGAFWCNAPAIEQPGRRFVIMGFNYQRSVREMVHDFGHRTESILAREFNSQTFLHTLYALQPCPPCANDFEEWLLAHGTVHRKPGGQEYGQDEIAWVTDLKPAWLPYTVNPNLLPAS
ncbi:MAG: hypothetical protein ACM3QS_04505 [Bacteroidota bacterium]